METVIGSLIAGTATVIAAWLAVRQKLGAANGGGNIFVRLGRQEQKIDDLHECVDDLRTSFEKHVEDTADHHGVVPPSRPYPSTGT